MTVRDEHRSVKILGNDRLMAEVHKCLIVPDHWWLIRLEGDRDHAASCIEALVRRLRGRGGTQVSVDPELVRPDLGRPFYGNSGFRDGDADLESRYPMELRL